MRRLAAIVLVFSVFFGGCSPEEQMIDRGISLRQNLLDGNGCEFVAGITADFGEGQYCFSLACKADGNGTFSFTVVSPEGISGIQGTVDDSSGKLTFDDTVLAFPLLAEGEIAPAVAPWLFWKSLLGGYLRSCGEDEDGLRLTIDDSFQGENLQVDVWLDKEDAPFYAEIFWEGRRLLSLSISQWSIL